MDAMCDQAPTAESQATQTGDAPACTVYARRTMVTLGPASRWFATVSAILVVVGCTAGPTATPPPDTPQSSVGPSASATASGTRPSDGPRASPPGGSPRPAPSDLTDDPGLEALFPAKIGGLPLTLESAIGEDVASLDSADLERLSQLAGAFQKELADVSVAEGALPDGAALGPYGVSFNIHAISVLGVPGSVLQERLVQIARETMHRPHVRVTTRGGKIVTRVEDAVEGVASYSYAFEDVLFTVAGPARLVEEAFAKLP